MIRNIISLFITGVLIVGCGSNDTTIDRKKREPIKDTISMGVDSLLPPSISSDVMDDFIENIASPVEMAALLKDLKVEFSTRYLAPTANADELTSVYQQAFYLGIYAADLGYLNMYNKTNSVMEYLTAIKSLADKVRVGQFFDFTTMKRLAQNNQNLDSLMYISVHSFNQMDRYLRDDKRSELSTLMIMGVWIESMYLITQVAGNLQKVDNTSETLKERIGEQKIILEKLLIILDNYRNLPNFGQLVEQVNLLKTEFDKVEIQVIPGEPVAVVIDGVLTIEQKDESVISIEKSTLNNIIQKTEIIRNKLTSI
ncbi:MAG: hypothetical protein JW801_08945 [Bacteroidales bacterium]|nr:hypothetical protein [Bacteroidales bacterium]